MLFVAAFPRRQADGQAAGRPLELDERVYLAHADISRQLGQYGSECEEERQAESIGVRETDRGIEI